MKIDTITIQSEERLPINNIYYFRSSNEKLNSIVEGLSEDDLKEFLPIDLRFFTYNISSIPSSEENSFSLLVPLTNHFVGDQVVEEDSAFLTGSFETEDTESVVEKFQKFLLEAAYQNFERVTGISYHKYQWKKLMEDECSSSSRHNGMMEFATINTHKEDDTTRKAKRIICKILEGSKLPEEEQIALLKNILDEMGQIYLCQNACELTIAKDDDELYYGIYYYDNEENRWEYINIRNDNDLGKLALYIFFLQQTWYAQQESIKQAKHNIELDKLDEYKKDIMKICEKLIKGDLSQAANKICKNADKYINHINAAFEKIFIRKIAKKYCITEKEGKYGIELNQEYIDLGDFPYISKRNKKNI